MWQLVKQFLFLFPYFPWRMHSFSYVRGVYCVGFYMVTSFNEASEDLWFHCHVSCFTFILCCSSV